MRKYRIIASEGQTALVREILRGLSADDAGDDGDADYAIVESGYAPLETGVSILFHPGEIQPLIRILNDLAGKNGKPDVLIGRKHETYEPVRPDQILFFRADGNTLFAQTEKQCFEMKHKLFEIENMFPGGCFIRVNKSYIVNILKVREIIPWFGGRLLLKISGNDEHIEVSRTYVRDFREYLGM